MILIFYAFAREIDPFKRRLKNRRPLEHRDLRGFQGDAAGTHVVAIATGIGLARARSVAEHAFGLYPDAEMAIGTGVAGALTAELQPGDLVLADRVMAYRSAALEPEHLSGLDLIHLEEIGRALRSRGFSHTSGTILTSHRVLANSAEKRRAREATGAIAVDMETASIAEAAAAANRPFACVRAIIDSVDDEVAGATLADENGEVRALAAASHLIRNPGEFLKLPRMMINLGRATRSIADALEAIATRKTPA